jgi:hypothetical protein
MTEDKKEKPSDSIKFYISEFDKEVADILPLMKAPGKWAAMNAIRHLNKAWGIHEVDPAMAIFRAITAEEEASTALFHALKRHKYNGAEKLNFHNHIHKNSVIPCIDAVSRAFANIGEHAPTTQLFIDKEKNPPLLLIRFKVPFLPEIWGQPIPPLNFSLSVETQENQKFIHDFAKEIEQIASEKNVKRIDKHLKDRANTRNKLLYASPEGRPEVKGDIVKPLKAFQRNAFTILRIFLMVDPYPEQQLFVQQVLDTFLKMLKILPADTQFD